MTTILATIIVLSLSGNPIAGARVEIEGMKWDYYNGENITDSRGHFVVEVTPGDRHTSVAKDMATWYGSKHYEKGKPVIVMLEDLP